MESADRETTDPYSIPDDLNDGEVYDASKAVTKFREEVVDNNSPCQLFTVSRMEGPEELQCEIMVCYKSKARQTTLGRAQGFYLRGKKEQEVVLLGSSF